METTNFDASTFNAWFSAWLAGNEEAQAIAERRFSDEFKVAFDAWIATDPANNPDAPKGPTYMPEYELPQDVTDEESHADEAYEKGAKAGETADDYVRITVLLASVLFLVGISGHFRVHSARIGLVERQRAHPDLRRRPADHGAQTRAPACAQRSVVRGSGHRFEVEGHGGQHLPRVEREVAHRRR